MPMEFSIDLGGLDARLQQAIPSARAEVKRELFQFASEVMAVSQERVPVDTGALMSTGRVEMPEEKGSEISVTLGYGSISVGYALAVHENMSAHVHWQRPGSGPKYLENPLKEVQGKLPGRIHEAVTRGFNR